jgi:hypothetical protein
MGNGLDESSVLGPLQNKQQFDIVNRLVESAKNSGARALLGGNPAKDQPGYFYPTTLVADIDHDNPLVVEEQFGPALPIIRYTTVDETIRLRPGIWRRRAQSPRHPPGHQRLIESPTTLTERVYIRLKLARSC